ncbi:MAG: glycosyltransferase [Caldimonas sp.]
MRIALLGPANSIHLRRWANALASRGHAVRLLSQHPVEPRDLHPAIQAEWLPHCGTKGYLLNAPRLRASLSAWRPDVLHAHYASGYGTTAMLSGYAPCLLSVWGSDVFDFPYQGPFRAWLLRRNLRSAVALTSTSEVMAHQVRRLTPERRDIAIIPFGVDLQRFAPTGSRRPDGPLTIGIVKSLAPKYGIDLLLRAFAGMRQDPDLRAAALAFRLVIVGDGPERSALQALARTLTIEAVTTFTGAVSHDEVPGWLNGFDIYAAPSRLDSESFGVAVIEASACAVPVVVTDVGGLPEVVIADRTGLIVPREDVPALQAALKRLLLDDGLRERLGSEGRRHVARTFDWEHCVDLMERCYERTLQKATGA